MAKSKNRKDDGEHSQRTFYRMSRFFTVNGEWFFCYREGEQIGPFETKDDAEQGAEMYADHFQQSGNSGDAEQVAKHGKWRATNYI